MIAIEPVIAPAATFSAIRIEFETIDRRAARVLLGAWAAGPTAFAGPITRVCLLGQVAQQQPRRPAAVADRVLLLGSELGHRAPVADVVGHERRVVAEAALAARLVA